MTREELVKKFGNENNLWYVDVKGVDQKGREVWLSGNCMLPNQCGFGGFSTYTQAMWIIYHFDELYKPTKEGFEYGLSHHGVITFTPKELYLGFSPIDDEDGENQIWKEKSIRL